MADLHRALCVLALLLVVSVAHALVPQAGGWRVTGPYTTAAYYPSKAAACDAAIAVWDAQSSWDVRKTTQNETYCGGTPYQPSGATAGPETTYGYQSGGSFCPANSTAVSGGCQCNTGSFENATRTACVIPADDSLEEFCLQGAAAKNGYKQSGTIGRSSPLPAASCYKPDPPFPGDDAPKGCAMKLGDVVAAPRDGDPLLKDWSSTGVMTGGVCEDAVATDAAPKAHDDPCPGGFQGTVNGEARCVAAEPDKGIEGVKNSSSTDATGTKRDVKETTKCEGGNCTTTTTTTTTTSSGAVSTSTTSTTTSVGDKCKADPQNPICQKTQGGKGSGVSQSTCQENPSAQGCGGEGAGIGDLYAKKDKTIVQVMKKASDDLKAAPLGSAVGGFFTVGSGGTCPSPSGVVPFLNKAVTFDMFCTNFAAQMFLIVRMVLLMLATWMAFRVAIDH